jgi:hypothetical protein
MSMRDLSQYEDDESAGRKYYIPDSRACACCSLSHARSGAYASEYGMARSIKRSAYTHLRSYQPAATNANALHGNCNYLQADTVTEVFFFVIT